MLKKYRCAYPHQRGLTRPELSVLLAYAKLQLFDDLVNSNTPDDPLLEQELFGYFPAATHDLKHAIVQHRLRREIIATRLSNEIVDTCGATFIHRVAERSKAEPAEIALGYEAARSILDLSNFANEVNALDNKASAELQSRLYTTASNLIEEQVNKIHTDFEAFDALRKRGVKGLIDRYKEAVQALKVALPDVLSPTAQADLDARICGWRDAGAPDEIAQQAAIMPALEFAFEIVNLAQSSSWKADNVAALFFTIGDQLSIDEARLSLRSLEPEEHFERLASYKVAEDLSRRQSTITASAINAFGPDPTSQSANWASQFFQEWRDEHLQAFTRL